MKLAFTKMHGCGNNYIYFNCFDQTVPDPESLSIKLSEPHFGIGGDGIILISPSDKADAQMRIFNADGSEGKMCGNGIRCVGKYLYDNGMTDGRTTITIDTLSGVKTLELTVKDGKMQSARVDMGAAILAPREIPVDMDGENVISAPIVVDEKVYHMTCVSMGNPHCVIFQKEDVDDLDLTRIRVSARWSLMGFFGKWRMPTSRSSLRNPSNSRPKRPMQSRAPRPSNLPNRNLLSSLCRSRAALSSSNVRIAENGLRHEAMSGRYIPGREDCEPRLCRGRFFASFVFCHEYCQLRPLSLNSATRFS